MILLADSEGPDQTALAQSDLGLRCPHMPEDMFSQGTAHIINKDTLDFNYWSYIHDQFIDYNW